MTDSVLWQQDGHVVTLTLNEPDTRNALTGGGLIDGICDALARLATEPDVRVAILTGAGESFSSGGNLKKMAEPGGTASKIPHAIRTEYKTGIQRIPLAFEDLEVPIIAAVNGHAIGAGLDLANMCDIRIAADNAKFAESFVKVGIIPGDGGAWLLPRAVSLSKAMEMVLTGDTIDAQEALACGMVSRVVPLDQLMAEARKLAARIAVNPPHAVRMSKRLVRQALNNDLRTVLELSAAMQALAHHTTDHREAVNAFVEKREPKFTGN
jgi:enoyl-CoA hydratase/carnithine racemase